MSCSNDKGLGGAGAGGAAGGAAGGTATARVEMQKVAEPKRAAPSLGLADVARLGGWNRDGQVPVGSRECLRVGNRSFPRVPELDAIRSIFHCDDGSAFQLPRLEQMHYSGSYEAVFLR